MGADASEPTQTVRRSAFHRQARGKGAEFVRGLRRTKQEWIITQAYRGSDRPPVVKYDARPDLFLTLAKTGDTKEEIKKFADEFGLLGFERERDQLDRGGKIYFGDPVSGMEWPGELLSAWQGAIVQMRLAVALWLAILQARNGNAVDLARHVKSDPRWDGGRGYVAVFREPDGSSAGFRSWRGAEMHARFKIGDLIGPAEEFLKDETTSHVAARLSRVFDRTETPGESPRWITGFQPSDLLSLMWHQFADALTGTGETEFRPCKRKGCLNLIRISVKGEGSRRHKVVCGNNCSVQISQKRARTARALFEAGKNPEEIAKDLGAKLLRVQTWIARDLAERGQKARPIARRLGLSERVVRDMLERKHKQAPVRN